MITIRKLQRFEQFNSFKNYSSFNVFPLKPILFPFNVLFFFEGEKKELLGITYKPQPILSCCCF